MVRSGLTYSIGNMSATGMRILIISDSRGSWLHREMWPFQSRDWHYKVVYKKGAGLQKLWEIAEWYLLTTKVDYLILLGGVCDLTDLTYYNGHREAWPPADMDARFDFIYQTLRDIASNFKLMNLPCKLTILPEGGLDLIRYNRIPHPVPWLLLVIQAELEDRLELLQAYTRLINSHMGSSTPWSLDLTPAYRNGKLRPVYDRTSDGLHYSRSQVVKLATIIATFTKHELSKLK